MARDTRDLGSLPLGVAIGLRNGLCHKEQLFPLAPSATPVEGWVGGWVGGWEAQIPPTLGPSPWASVPWASVPFLRLSKTQLLREVGGGPEVCLRESLRLVPFLGRSFADKTQVTVGRTWAGG